MNPIVKNTLIYGVTGYVLGAVTGFFAGNWYKARKIEAARKLTSTGS